MGWGSRGTQRERGQQAEGGQVNLRTPQSGGPQAHAEKHCYETLGDRHGPPASRFH